MLGALIARLDRPELTTKVLETFSPASSGRVHIFVTASRAELAWIVHMPGSPALTKTWIGTARRNRLQPRLRRRDLR